jgi:hypothetical protein
LLVAAKTPLQSATDGSLDLVKVAQFLAWLACCDTDRLAWVRGAGLRLLGIERVGRKVGRRRGREKSASYLFYLRVARDVIKTDGIWSKRLELEARYPYDWKRRLRREIKKNGWDDETVTYLLTARTPRSLAIYMVSRHFDVTYDAVERGVQRAQSVEN